MAEVEATAQPGSASSPRRFRLDPRFLAPLLITTLLVAGQLSFGFLESWSRTLLAIATAMATELILVRSLFGRWPHLASAYVSGISIGILVRSLAFWPYALGSAISITSKYVLRVRNQHLWNPTNLGVVALLLLASDSVAGLSIQWGNNLLPMVVVWTLGTAILHRVNRLHVTLTYLVSFVILAALRSAVTGQPFLGEISPLTGPMYQLFMFFMITDPKTTVGTRRGRIAVTVLIAIVEAVFRHLRFVYAPFYALFLVGPIAKLVEIERAARRPSGHSAPAWTAVPPPRN